MNDKSRTNNTIINFIVGFGTQLFQYALSFATRTIFIALLPLEYLGVNGLFTNVLAVLSLAEMGVGGAFVSLLYKPLYEKDTEKLKSLMTAFKKAYMIIGVFVGIAGLALYPFLDVFVRENNIDCIDILKIDTETFEAHVLRGGSDSLSKTKYLFIEITMENNDNYTISSLLKLLSTENYDFQLVGFRNYNDTSEGLMPIMDGLFFNKKLIKK